MIYSVEANCRCGKVFRVAWDSDVAMNPKMIECPQCADRWPVLIATADGITALGHSEGEVVGKTEFQLEVEKVINRTCAENGSDTPDHILAEYLASCLAAFDNAVNARREWYGDETSIRKG